MTSPTDTASQEEFPQDAPSVRSNGATVAFITMGCAKNEVDSAHMAEDLQQAGYQIAEDPEHADVVIVNTCCFIQSATEESIDAVLEAFNLPAVISGESKVIVAGCMPARYGTDLESELAEASAFVPCAREDHIVSTVDALVNRSDLAPETFGTFTPKVSFGPFAYVKISDGCDRFCSYCTIPYIRGRYHSFTYERIYDETKKRIDEGAREIVLIAQDTGRWGTDFEEPSSLAVLMENLASAFPQTWFRVMYIQPEGVTDSLIEAVATHDNICNYFDLPFQHVNEDVLKNMNRVGSKESFQELIERIRKRIPDATLRTTLIAGYPGETDEQFEELCDFVEECDLDYIGVFAYSREEGTRAYHLDDQIDEDEKAYRAQRLRDLADDVCMPRVAQRTGLVMPVLVCGTEEDGQLFGRAMCQAPDVDGVTYLNPNSAHPGDIVMLRIDDTLLYEMEGTVIPS